MIKRILLLLSFFSFTACQEKTTDMSTDSSAQWNFIEGQDHGKMLKPVSDHKITLQIFPEKWTGTAGVNYYQMSVQTLANKTIKVSGNSAITTRMAGNPQAMDMENRYLSALVKVTKMDMKNNQLILSGEKIELVFQQ